MMFKRLLIFISVILALAACEDNKVDEGAVNLVTVTADANGTASSDLQAAAQGQKVTLVAEPDEGYVFAGWVVTSGNLVLEDATANPLVFTMPAAAVSFRATFREADVETFPISVTASDGGEVNYGARKSATDPDMVERPEEVAAGYTVAISATADAGYRFVEWSVEKGNVELSSKFEASATFTMPAEEVAITAMFEEASYSLTVDEPENGSIDVSVAGGLGLTELTEGTIITVTATPAEGYKFIRWEIEGAELNSDSIGNSEIIIKMPGNDVVISAVFELPVEDVIEEITDPVFKAYAQYRMTHEQEITVDSYWYGDDPKSPDWVTITPVTGTYPAWDTDGDGKLSEPEAAAVTAIDVSRDALDAIGISGTVNSVAAGGYFYNLQLLHASYQQIETLDAGEFPLLVKLICDHCGLKNLSIDKCALLEELFVEHNYLTSLSLNRNKNLYKLSCWDNNIDSNDGSINLDISNMKVVDGMYFLRAGAQRNAGDNTLRDADDLPQLTREDGESTADYQARVNEVYGSIVAVMSLNSHNPHWSNVSDPESSELKYNRNVGWAAW